MTDTLGQSLGLLTFQVSAHFYKDFRHDNGRAVAFPAAYGWILFGWVGRIPGTQASYWRDAFHCVPSCSPLDPTERRSPLDPTERVPPGILLWTAARQLPTLPRRARLIGMTDEATVSLAHCVGYAPEEVRRSVQGVFKPFGGVSGIVHPGERILLKPNFVTKPSGESPTCTHPEVILAVARLVREAGATPTIGDSPGFGTAESIAKSIGLMDQAEREGFAVQTLRRAEKREVRLNGQTFRLSASAEAFEFDGIINLPKFKAHRQVTLTFGIKNLFGCVPGKRKAGRHFSSHGNLEWFNHMLVANAKLLNPRFTLVDGIVAMERNGPVTGDPRPLNVLVGGTDVTAVDVTCCRIVNYDPSLLGTLQAARDQGFGTSDPDRIVLEGPDLELFVVSDFRFARQIPIFFSLRRLVKSCLRSWRDMAVSGRTPLPKSRPRRSQTVHQKGQGQEE